MKKYKIAIVTQSLSAKSGSRVAVELSQHLQKLGNNVSVYAYDSNQKISRDLALKKINVFKLSKIKSKILSRLIPDYRLTKLLRSQAPDVAILTAFLPSIIAAKLAGIATIRIYMGTQFGAYLENKNPNEKVSLLDIVVNKISDTFIFLSELISARLSGEVVAISNYCAKEMKKLYYQKAKVIYLGGNHLPVTRYQSPKTTYKRPFHLLSVSRITPYKNFHLLIEMVKSEKLRKKVDLTIVGTSIKPKYLSYLKRHASPNVHFKTNVSDRELAKLYASCHAYITCDRYLFFGLPIAEAAFFQKPSIALDYAAAKELIDHGKTGYIAKNLDEFVMFLEKLTIDPKLIQNLGKNAQKKAQKIFNWQRITEQYQVLLA